MPKSNKSNSFVGLNYNFVNNLAKFSVGYFDLFSKVRGVLKHLPT